MEIELKNITKKYGANTALDDFSAVFTTGVYGLLGPNGSGKSTLINVIVGLLKRNSGEIFFDGKSVSELGETYLENIGYLPQYPKFYPNYTVYEFMHYMSVLKALDKKDIPERIDSLLTLVNLEAYKDRKTSALSGGMRQRLGIAQALLNNPRFLILDEPTAGLDPLERIRFRNLISGIAEERTVLLATHIVSDISFIANRILLLKNGKLLLMDKPENLLKTMNGNVWLLTVSPELVMEYQKRFQISNVRYTEAGCELRIVSEKCPDVNQADLVLPNLEDVYLYYFGERGAE